MNFKIKKIRKNPPQAGSSPLKTSSIPQIKNASKKFHISLGLIGSLLIIVILMTGIVKAVSSIDFKFFLSIAGDDLKTDAYGHTNFLILGTGGKNHEGSDLTDTMIVASIDDTDKLVTMISIPRDIYVQDKVVGNSKINEVYYNAEKYYGNSTEGLDHVKNKIEELMGIPIHYWVKINFDGFKELVDALDGIDIYVKDPIYDPYYPKDGTYLYETFSIAAGQQHMDGEMALKYARSRKTTSDFDRADRQQQIIFAIKEKALQTETALSADRITKILDALKKNIETNITVKEILTLGALGSDYSSDKILHRLIHDDPTQCGGFLYTPERQYYGGMFVLIPAGGFEFIHLYSDLNFNLPKIATERSRIHILNGTKKGGVAGETKQILKRFCFDIVRFGNAPVQDITQTTYYYSNARPETLNFLQKIIPGKESVNIPQKYLEAGYLQQADIIMELGSDYVNSDKYIKDPFYYLPAQKTTTEATTSPETPSSTPSPTTPTP